MSRTTDSLHSLIIFKESFAILAILLKKLKIFKSSLETTYNETSQFVEESYEVTDPRTL